MDNPFAMVVAIVAIVMFAGVLKGRNRHGMPMPGFGRSDEDERLINDMQKEIRTLGERVRVLEKLVTDDDRKLASEIERLRTSDRPSADYR